MPETQYIKVNDTEFKEVVTHAVESVATLDDLINLRANAEVRRDKEQATMDELDAKIVAVRAIGVKTADEVIPEPEEEVPGDE